MRTKKIEWDTDGDKEVFEALPQEVELPGRFNRDNYMDESGEVDEMSWSEDIGDYLSDTYGFCHSGFTMEMDMESGDKDDHPECYNPNHAAYPLCNGNGHKKCHDCNFFEDYEDYHDPYPED